ncbi:YfaZ family protein [Mucilaginibacter roseus]|uniref:YfaZ family protein n=1 Tax=Mucilaginibacter roseus TaxID=1528868 RepID=A0ABS8U0Y5_9SPHI|nr:YfaZ family protein [Mucilaginibacter roseus]MCD8739419.1 YfaZ family protein [Mucilaginibacter roseus]
MKKIFLASALALVTVFTSVSANTTNAGDKKDVSSADYKVGDKKDVSSADFTNAGDKKDVSSAD